MGQQTKKQTSWRLLLLALIMLSACDKEGIYKNNENKKSYEGPSVMFEGVRTFYSENAKLKIKIEAKEQRIERNGDVTYRSGIEIGMYNSGGFRTTTLTADSARLDRQNALYQAFGNVVVHNLEQKQTLFTEELEWQQSKKQIATEKPIRIITEYERLEGIGLVSDEEFARYKILKPTGAFSVNN